MGGAKDMTKLVFHLGDMKSGSTAIQTVLSSRRWVCDGVKLVYPHRNKVSHMVFAQSLGGRVDPSRTKRLARDIMAEVRDSAADVAVISAEHFENVDPEALKAAIMAHMPGMLADARFIAYVRPHAERLVSTYAERVKIGQYVGTLAQMPGRDALFYTPRFQAWRKTFGAAFELRVMQRDRLYRRDVVADFLQFALKTDDFTVLETLDANELLSLENLSIVRELHVKLRGGKPDLQAWQSTIGRSLARQMNEGDFGRGTRIALDRAMAARVCARYAADAAALDAAFFDGTPMTDALQAAPDAAVEVAQSVRIEDHFSAREQALIHGFLDQMVALVQADPELASDTLRTAHRSRIIAAGDEDAPEGDALAG